MRIAIQLFLSGFILCVAIPTYAQPVDSSRYWHGQPRTLRYHPNGDAFVITNGRQRFTRAIYGTHTGFRFETSDFPEFGLYMPNLGGSMYLALATPTDTVWMAALNNIVSRFQSGQRTYVMKDSTLLGQGTLTIDAVALADADGLVVKVTPAHLPADIKLIWIYGGANHQRFSRGGDLGADPPDCFYIKPAHCEGNTYTVRENSFTVSYGRAKKGTSHNDAPNDHKITGLFPSGTMIRLADGNRIDSLSKLLTSDVSTRPVAIAEYPLLEAPCYFSLYNPETHTPLQEGDLAVAFTAGINYRRRIASALQIQTPDPFMNTLGGIFAGAEDAVWEAPSYLHGAVGWRIPLTGWRAAYLGDLLGKHDRARTHFDGYINAQVTDVPVTLPPTQDQALHLARASKQWGTPLYSNGYICRNPNQPHQMHHYDMNLVFIDELLWHLQWTGDLTYARKIFPVLQRHLAWEKHTFDPDHDGLYDAYCCIWASDALQYNGGKVTHASAYNYRANKLTAEIARMLGEDATPYEAEAQRIQTAIQQTLWIADKGWWAEFKDTMGHGMLHDHAALWSIYHAIDSEVPNAFEAYEATRYVDTALPHIPVVAEGLDDTTHYVVATTDWQPYQWSINNVAFAEVAHTALAYWQAGRREEAFKMYKGAILDAMYLGSGPGNITQVSYYDAARGELYRDFADPVAMAVRAMVQGMFGILPDLLHNRLVIRPGFPATWDSASLHTQHMTFRYKRTGHTDRYTIEPSLQKQNITLTLEVNAPYSTIQSITVNGQPAHYTLVEDAITLPKIQIDAGQALKYEVVITWAGGTISDQKITTTAVNHEACKITLPYTPIQLYDPQGVLAEASLNNHVLTGMVSAPEGHRTVFVKVTTGNMHYWLPVDIHVVPPLTILQDSDAESLTFTLVNNSSTAMAGTLSINGHRPKGEQILLPGKNMPYTIASSQATLGSNDLEIKTKEKSYHLRAINWNLKNPTSTHYTPVDMQPTYNEKVNQIFAYDKYLAPRYAYTTLQVPTQGMGQWCHPNDLSVIDDTGLRKEASQHHNTFTMPQGIPFATSGDSSQNNIVLTTLWDNYPAQVTMPLHGKASKAYLLIAASTYHMQSHILNGQIRVTYQDGTESVLDLILPDNLLPLDQDLFIDDGAFTCPQPRPWRVRLKTGAVSRHHAEDLGIPMSNNPIYVDGGMATMLDLPLDAEKELKSVTLETIANEVIIGLMGVTLMQEE